ncbi:MAG: phosphoglycerate mutase (2,3-diphosphoglycerate-independent) [Legionellales bacterium]|nr:phosphoglycerate mutase (2,3-diphosphoglycerate-independent) [Legionellales bacterium]
MGIHKSAVLILDGWGIRKESRYNAIATAHTPNWDYLTSKYSMSLLSACGESVGLPRGQMGNSEVGHMHIGTGQIIKQALCRINESISSGQFEELLEQQFYRHKGFDKVHLVGLASNGGVHSHLDHWLASLSVLKNIPTRLHIFTDGRDTQPKVANKELQKLIELVNQNNNHLVQSVSGRFYGMDRDKRWERTNLAFDAINGHCFTNDQDVLSYIEKQYTMNITDEFIEPKSFLNEKVSSNDLVIAINFRPDRMVQIASKLKNTTPLISFTDYKLGNAVLFTPPKVKHCLGSIISSNSLSQVRIAETEKYPHVTYFLNGGVDDTFDKEKRLLVSSPKVKTYDECPQMSCEQVTQHVITEMKKNTDCIVANYANADMVGHTGNFDATVKACEWLDRCIGEIYNANKKCNYELFICADHGNAEWMFRPESKTIMKSHTPSLIPLMYCRPGMLKQKGRLSDILPTLLTAMNLSIPTEIMGENLLLSSN